ncbi:hypothetical protein TNCV_2339631 [Trichonephila clavipes]|nr:hypothetical protein TNCV_2339631 [Trichonephila clavipes]
MPSQSVKASTANTRSPMYHTVTSVNLRAQIRKAIMNTNILHIRIQLRLLKKLDVYRGDQKLDMLLPERERPRNLPVRVLANVAVILPVNVRSFLDFGQDRSIRELASDDRQK